MEKHSWHRVHLSLHSTVQPVPRWGHTCCVIDEEIVFFGGYAESIYMNDVWSFNTVTMEWNQIKTTGDIPTQRSNCSMSYDRENHRIIVFGGGGPNKRRFNTINILNWITKQWIQIYPKENQQAPWERTYHTAELAYPYLIVFGGQGVNDLDDLWIFDFITLSWSEIPIKKEDTRPCARRFHSSAIVDNQFFVIAGCHSKYRCLKDVYSLDLTPLFKNKNISALKWKQLKPQGSAFLTRWGHSSAVYNGNIYIFGGRFSNDLNDVLILDIEKNKLKNLKTSTDLPKARRRHSACFVGSCMIIFGGFNGQYYNDLFYINTFELKSKLAIPSSSKEKSHEKFYKNSYLSDCSIRSSEGETFHLHKGYLMQGFEQPEHMDSFINSIDRKWSKNQIQMVLSKIYEGYGVVPFEQKYKHKIVLPENKEEKDQHIRKLIQGQQKLNPLRKKKQLGSVVELPQDKFSDFLDRTRQNTYFDVTLIINQKYQIKTNKLQVCSASNYFQHLLSSNYKEKQQIKISLDHSNVVIFQILLNYLLLDVVVVPETIGYENWMQLYQLAEYYCLKRLTIICEQQICNSISQETCNSIFEFGLTHQIQTLFLCCSDYMIKCMVNKEDKYQLEEASKIEAKDHILEYMYNLSRFDILQVRLERIKLLDNTFKHKQIQSTLEEKENYQILYND